MQFSVLKESRFERNATKSRTKSRHTIYVFQNVTCNTPRSHNQKVISTFNSTLPVRYPQTKSILIEQQKMPIAL